MDIEAAINQYSNMLYKICFVIMGNKNDAEDALQETFFRFIRKPPDIKDKEHEKAWLIKVATNICRDMKRFQIRHTYMQIEDIADYLQDNKQKAILEEVLSLPRKQKEVIYLHYIEGYKINELANILRVSENVIKKRLQRGRVQLKLILEE